jgi:outer membrane protein OmpU
MVRLIGCWAGEELHPEVEKTPLRVRVENGIMNYKLLLSSTALASAGVLFAGSASAQDFEVSLQGYTEFQVQGATNETLNDADGDRGYGFFMDNEVHVLASGTADNGVQYGTIVEIEAGSGYNTNDVFVDEVMLFFSGAFGRVELGQEDGVEDVMHVDASNIAAGTGGIDGDVPNLPSVGGTAGYEVTDTSDATKAQYFTPRVGGFQLGVGYTPDFDPGDPDDPSGVDEPSDAGARFGNSVAVGANWTGAFAGLDVTIDGVGHFAENEGFAPGVVGDDRDVQDWAVGFNTEFAGFALGGAFVQKMEFAESNIYNAGVGFGFGPVNTSINYNYLEPDAAGVDNQHFVDLGADVGVLPGVVLKADVAWNSADPGADGDESIAGLLGVQLNY